MINNSVATHSKISIQGQKSPSCHFLAFCRDLFAARRFQNRILSFSVSLYTIETIEVWIYNYHIKQWLPMIANDLHKSHGSIHYFAAFDLALVFFVVIDFRKATLATRPVGLLTLMDQGSQFQSLHVFVSFISMRYAQGKVNGLSMKVCFFQKHSAQCLDLSKKNNWRSWLDKTGNWCGFVLPMQGLPPHQVNQVNNTALFENAEAGCAIFGLLQRRDGEVTSVIPVFDGDLMVKSLFWNLFDVAPQCCEVFHKFDVVLRNELCLSNSLTIQGSCI